MSLLTPKLWQKLSLFQRSIVTFHLTATLFTLSLINKPLANILRI